MDVKEIETLRKVATTDREREYLDALVASNGSATWAAEEMEISRSTINKAIYRMRCRVEHPELAPHVPDGFHVAQVGVQTDADGNVGRRTMKAKPGIPEPVGDIPPGHMVKGVSVQTNAAGEVIQQWTKTREGERDPLEVVRVLQEAWAQWKAPGLGPVLKPSHTKEELLALIHIGDAHLNLLAHESEGGAESNLEIGRDQLLAALRELIHLLPAAGVCVIQQLGDFLHNDNQSNGTPKSGNQLDVSSRYWKALKIAGWAHVAFIKMALEKFGKVYIHVVPGNHDENTAHAIAMGVAMYFHDEPRVVVAPTQAPFYVHVHGVNMIASCHGHKAKGRDAVALISASYSKEWGETKTGHRRLDMGHVHHKEQYEYSGMTVTYHNTLAASDGYHTGRYVSSKTLTADVLHRDWGRVSGAEVHIDRVHALLGDGA